ncbi:MAG: PepSY domain-containing protein [Planctomycetota bacterium]
MKLTKLNKLIRRIHLYTGIFLIPWIFLYGVTAFLFNHPGAFSEVETQTQPWPQDVPPLPDPALLADRVVAELDARHPESGWFVTPGATPRFEAVFFRSESDGVRYDGSFRPHLGTWKLRSRPAASESDDTIVEKDLLEDPEGTLVDVEPLAVGLLDSKEVSVESVKVRRGARLTIPLTNDDGEESTATYTPSNDQVKVEPASAPTAMRRFLLRLHMLHGYPDEVGARWIWAVLVDVMAATMVFWGLSGLWMWWQIRRTRVAGAVALVGSLALAAALGVSLYSR